MRLYSRPQIPQRDRLMQPQQYLNKTRQILLPVLQPEVIILSGNSNPYSWMKS